MNNKRRFLSIVLSIVLTISLASGVPVSAASKAKINRKKVTITVGKTVNLKIKNNKKKVQWKSSNKKVATVSKKGKVKGKRAGKAIITAKIGKKKFKCTVFVKAKNNKPSVTPTTKPVVTYPATTKPAATEKPTEVQSANPTTTVKPTEAEATKPTTTVKPTEAQPTNPATTEKPTVVQPTTTQQPTTQQPTTDDGKPGPKEVFGHTIISKKGLEVSYTWGSDEEIQNSGQTFNVYYDGVLGEQAVPAGLLKHTFTTAGSHTITIKGYLNGKESQGVELKVTLEERDPSQGVYWQAITGEPANTYFYDDNTAVNVVSIQKPPFASETGIYMNVAAGITSVSINGKTTGYVVEGAGTVVYLSALSEELNTVVITHALGEDKVVIKNSTKSSTQPTTQAPTEPAVTTPVTTQPQTTKPQPTTQPQPSFQMVLQ